MALYIQSGVVTPFMFDVYSFMYGLDPLWCKQDTTIHSVVQKKKSALSVIQFVVSCRLTFRIFPFECDFICDVFFCSASHLPLPSHTTHSVGSTGRALWVYAVCGVWGGWVGFLLWSLCSLRWRENFRDTLHRVSCVSS